MVYAQRLHALISLCFRLVKLRLSHQPGMERQSRKLLFEGFQDLGGVYVKFLQIMAMKVDFMTGWAGPSDYNVFEAVSLEYVDVQGLVKAELPPEAYAQFRSITPEPFAAGSFAQVYRAELQDGKQVIIKVLRPSLVRHLKFDLRLLGLVTRIAQWLYPTGAADVTMAYRQFATATLAETDYRRELANAQWFYAYFANNPNILIPQTYSALSSGHVMTQDFVDGISLAEIMNISRQTGEAPDAVAQRLIGANLWTQMEHLGKEVLASTLTADFVLGDPHPGNIRLLPGDTVGLIDFGITAAAPSNRAAWLGLMQEYQKLYADMFDPHSFTLAALNFFDQDLVESLAIVGRQLGIYDSSSLMNKIGESAARILQTQANDPLIQMYIRRRMMTRLFDSINQGNRFGINLDLESTIMFKAAHTYLVLIDGLARNRENYAVIQNALAYAINTANHAAIPVQALHPAISTSRAVERVSAWLSQVADHDPFLYKQLIGTIKTT